MKLERAKPRAHVLRPFSFSGYTNQDAIGSGYALLKSDCYTMAFNYALTEGNDLSR
jgi:hypothetical protein